MDTSLGNERSATLPGRYKAAFTLAALVVMSAFATDTAIPAAARPADAPTVIPNLISMSQNSMSPDGISRSLTSSEIVTTVPLPRITVLTRIKSGLASWYGSVLQGHLTASGRRFDMNELTAAHRTLPFGSKVKVTDLRNKRSVIVTITDRGVLYPNRIIDLSLGAARQLNMVRMGVDPVRLELLNFQN